MTFHVVMETVKKLEIDVKKVWIRVSMLAGSMPGTSSELQPQDLFTLEDLLYGMLLPSGNDAALALGEGVGRIIYGHQQG